MKKLALGVLAVGLLVACSDKGVKLVDSTPVDAMEVCNPLAQTGCLAGEKCAWITDVLATPTTDGVGHIGCAPDGNVPIDGACMRAVGASPCAAGGECVNGVCKQICDHQGGTPQCDANHACSRYSNLFESADVTVAGVCDPKCDPLTQELVIGTVKAACGSMTADNPNNGCYTFDNVDFTCAGIPDEAKGKIGRTRAYGPASGGVYVNGCEAGYLPFFIETTGSMIGICAGMCAPVKTDSANTTAPTGSSTVPVKLPTKATAVAGDGRCTVGLKGSSIAGTGPENCHFLWPYNIENNVLIPSPYNDTLGLCFSYAQYTVDHDMNATTPRVGYPSCQSLPPKGTATPAACMATPLPATCLGTAEKWPCVTSTEAASRQAKGAAPDVHPAVRDFRVGAYGSGTGLRHVLR